MSIKDLYPIRTVAAVTGMNPVTLRAWERRYGFIKPVRTETGQRMYTREHIDLVHRVRAMLDRGMAIGQVSASLRTPAQKPAKADVWSARRERMVVAISQFDEATLETLYEEALSAHPLDRVTRSLLVPLLAELGSRWESGAGSVAEEHFFAMYVRNKIGARFHHRTQLTGGPKVLGACAPGEHHEIGLMLFALAAHDAGIRSVLLGANTPLAELPSACRRARCDAVVISSSTEPAPEFFSDHLPALVVNSEIPVFVGGETSVRYRDRIVAAGAVALGTDLPLGVKRLAQQLRPAEASR